MHSRSALGCSLVGGRAMTATVPAVQTGPLAGDPRMLIDGELRDATAERTFGVENPATGEIVGQAADGSAADMDHAIAAARRAFDTTSWACDVEFRYHCLIQFRDALVDAKERLRRIVVTEAGTPIATTSAMQLAMPLQEAAYWPEFGRSFEYWRDTGIQQSVGMMARHVHQYDPVGVVGAITPWNAPIYLNVAESVPALMAGNAVVLKPAQLTPWSGSELGRIVAEHTDIPPGIFNVVLTNDNEVAAGLTSDPRVDMITFTGSTATGRRILGAAAPTVKKVFLELGGKSAHIVLDDADFGEVIAAAAGAICMNSGQACTLAGRVLVPRARYQECVELAKAAMDSFPYGDPWDPANLQGPAINRTQQDKVLRLVAAGVESGARLVTGGRAPEHLPRGYYIEPTLLTDVPPSSVVGQEEIFGPVMLLMPYDSEDEAIAIANDTIYGLSGQVSGADEQRALSIARRIRAGTIRVNNASYFAFTSPLGGYRQSGLGRRNGTAGFEEYLEVKTIGLSAGPS